MSRRQRANDEFGGVFGPQDDIDLFAAQLVAHGRNARTAHAHAGADGIYALVVGNYSDLGAHARIARGSLDFKQALFDPGYFVRSEEHTSALQSLMRISYAVFCLKKKQHTLK